MSEASPETPSGLSPQRQQFCDFYLGEANFNAARAAEKAGYGSPKQRGYELLREPEIREYLDRCMAAKGMGQHELLARLADIARGPGPWASGAGCRAYIDVEAMIADGFAHLIKGVKETYTPDGTIQTVEFHDATGAIALIGKYHKLFTDRVQLDMDEDALNAAIERGLAALATDPEAGAAAEDSGQAKE